MPSTMPLEDESEDSRTDDQMRLMKERDIKRKENEAAARLQLEQTNKINRAKLTKLNNDLKNKKYTYDEAGKIILVNGIKLDKLPPAAYLVNYAVQNTTEEDQLQQVVGRITKAPPRETKKETKKETELAKPVKIKKAPVEEKIFVKDLGLSLETSIWENLKPEDGVTLTEQGKRKAGKRYTSLSMSNSTQNLPTMPMNPYDISGKITLKEYKKRIKDGNLSREPSRAEFETSADKKVLVESINYEIVNPQPNQPAKHRKTRSIDMRVLPDKSSMKVHSSKLLENLLKVEMEPIFPKISSEGSHLAPVIDDAPQITNIDQFNLKIITSKEWGSNVPLPTTANPQSFSKFKHRNYKASFSDLFKPHRTRTLLNSSLTPSHFLNVSSSEFLKGSQSPSHSINSISNLTLMK